MPNYVFTGTVPMIFGGFQYGNGISVAGVTDKDGQTVVLFPDAFVTSQTPIDHAFLTLMPDKLSKASPVAESLAPVIDITPTVEAPQLNAESLPEPTIEPTVVDAPADSTPVTGI